MRVYGARARLCAIAAFAGIAIVASAACNSAPDEPDNPYAIAAIPWQAPERLRYVLQNDNGKEIGRGILAAQMADGQLVISESFGDSNATDDTVLVVDPVTLKPSKSERTLTDKKNDERRVVDTEYGDLSDGKYGVRIRQRVFDPAASTDADSTRCNPLRLPESAFDNDSSLYLWRTLPFEDGLRVQYTASIPGRRSKRIVTLVVRKQEDVTTPAGSFKAWHLEIQAEGQSHDAWFDVEAPHRMVKYDNDQQIFLYEGSEDAGEVPELPKGVSVDCKS